MSGALGNCSPTRLLCLLGLNPSDEDDHVSDRVLIMLDPNDREGALANILYRIRACANDHEGALVRSLELVHRLVGLYRICKKSLRKREMTEMKRSIFEEGEQVGPGLRSLDPASLYCAFEQVKDGRKAEGKRYPLALILTLLMLGKLAGETTIHGIVDWIKERKGVLKQLLNWPKGFPVHSTYSAAEAPCDGQELAQVIAQVLIKARALQHRGAQPSRM